MASANPSMTDAGMIRGAAEPDAGPQPRVKAINR